MGRFPCYDYGKMMSSTSFRCRYRIVESRMFSGSDDIAMQAETLLPILCTVRKIYSSDEGGNARIREEHFKSGRINVPHMRYCHGKIEQYYCRLLGVGVWNDFY